MAAPKSPSRGREHGRRIHEGIERARKAGVRIGRPPGAKDSRPRKRRRKGARR